MKLTIFANVTGTVQTHEANINRLGEVREHVKAFGLIHNTTEMTWSLVGDGSITTPLEK